VNLAYGLISVVSAINMHLINQTLLVKTMSF